MFKKTEGSADL